ncbi:mechanosensitive ion channel family protein [Pelagivirga sediminicola]|uniref:Small-conductance mechanosensitive channel n=1 Tax=Pelagivirga sediminicola TaxID=2170575 RepID=A0A2T7G7B6_9RHOB|nr:mechanosensitive ion channel family protein [Pelagivirga sediminicola]PVA10321.1 mechanosensitive ion channel family protein [Pelagivirga sediminicola]
MSLKISVRRDPSGSIASVTRAINSDETRFPPGPSCVATSCAPTWFTGIANRIAVAQSGKTGGTPTDTSGAAPADEDDAAPETPAYLAGLDNPSIPLDELRLRLVPLTAAELATLAEAWQANARDATLAVVQRNLELREAGGAATDAQLAAREDLLDTREDIFERYSAVVTSLEAKGGDAEVIKSLRIYRTAISVEEAATLEPREIAVNVLAWLVSPEGGIDLAIRIAVVLAALLGLLIVARIVRAWSRRMFGRVPNLSKLLQGFLAMVVYWLVIAVGLMIVLAALGVNVTPLFALLGGASFIVAFAMQDTLGNLAAGLMIMINRPFDEGDYVTAAGVAGTVRKVSVVSTTVTTPDNQFIVIPNSKVWGDVIINTTASDTRRVDLVFGIGYEDSIEEAQETLENVLAQHPKIMKDPAPVIRVNELGASSVNFIVRPWVRAEDYWDVYWDLTRQVKEVFDERGLTIPFPQTEMRIKGDSKSTETFAPAE